MEDGVLGALALFAGALLCFRVSRWAPRGPG